MRHKYLILGLSVALVALIVAKRYEPTQFPMRIDFRDYAYGSKKEELTKKSDKLIEFRRSQDFADIPWDTFSIGENEESVNHKNKNTTDSTIILNGNPINARVIKFFSPTNKLIEIDLQFKNAPQQLTNEILAMFGNKYLQIYEHNDLMHINTSERYFWIKNAILVIYEIDRIGHETKYLTIADVSDFSENELKEFIRYGHVASYSIKEPFLQNFLEKVRTPQSYTPSTTKKKYGDSDVYQGSSKQKEDLEAIDKYFGL